LLLIFIGSIVNLISSLTDKAIKEELSEDDIKKSIKNWKEDTYKV